MDNIIRSIDCSVMAANLKHAAHSTEYTEIGGGVFNRDELAQAANLLAVAPELLAALEEIVGQKSPNKYGYDAAEVALNDAWRNKARAAIVKAKMLR